MKNVLLTFVFLLFLPFNVKAQSDTSSKNGGTINQNNQIQKTYYLDFKGLEDKETYSEVEKLILKTKGIVSLKANGTLLKWYALNTSREFSKAEIESLLTDKKIQVVYFSQDFKDLERYMSEKYKNIKK